VIDAERYSEDDLMIAVEAGAEDIVTDEDVFEVITEPGDFAPVRKALEDAGVEMESAELLYRPSSVVPIDEGQAGKLMRLIESLEDSDDVSAVHANFDVSADVLNRVLADERVAG
jgi:transcriptional/translational regulatory protein YebC/TACO1